MKKFSCWALRIFAGVLKLLFYGAQLATVRTNVAKMLSFVPDIIFRIFISMNFLMSMCFIFLCYILIMILPYI